MAVKNKAGQSALELFAAELRVTRAAAGMSQEELAELINFSSSLVGMVETARRPPSLEFAKVLDQALKTNGLFARLHHYVSSEAHPVWFREWVEVEREASALRGMEPMLIPGLLQTAQYARAILGARAYDGQEDLDQRVAARLERQEILDREDPPRLWFLLDELVLHRCIGGHDVMRDQLAHVVEMSHRPRVSVQIVPATVGAHACMEGGFAIAGLEDGPDVVYLESAAGGHIVEDPSTIAHVMLSFDTVRSEALPKEASREFILKVAEDKWT